MLRRAVELGVDFIDTADSYGPEVSELLLAEALHPYPDNLVIATKGGLERPGPDRWTPNGRPEHLRSACEGSLRRLRLEQIPLYQFHRPDPAVPSGGFGRCHRRAQGRGQDPPHRVVQRDRGAAPAGPALTPIVSIQNRYNLTDRGSESLVDLCEQEQIAFLPWAPIQDLDGRRSSARSPPGTTPRIARWRSPGCSPARRRCWSSPGRRPVPTSRERRRRRSSTSSADEVAALTAVGS